MTTSNHRLAAVAAGAALLVGFGSFGAVASGLITSEDIKNHEVKSADIDRDAVGSGKIEDGSVKMRDLDPATVTELKGAQTAQDAPQGEKGEKGDIGPAGPQGPAGPAGPPATVGISHWSEGATVPAAVNGMPGSILVKAFCQQEGHYAISGGYTAGTYKGGVTTYVNYGIPGMDPYAPGWQVGFTNTTDQPQSVRTWVVCAEVVEDEPGN